MKNIHKEDNKNKIKTQNRNNKKKKKMMGYYKRRKIASPLNNTHTSEDQRKREKRRLGRVDVKLSIGFEKLLLQEMVNGYFICKYT